MRREGVIGIVLVPLAHFSSLPTTHCSLSTASLHRHFYPWRRRTAVNSEQCVVCSEEEATFIMSLSRKRPATETLSRRPKWLLPAVAVVLLAGVAAYFLLQPGD